MPPVNQAVIAASVGLVVASVAVAAAIAAYESPEVRRAAENLRRRIAIALHALGDNFDQDRHRDADLDREPVFNRPEDAQGFRLSRGSSRNGADPGVDADEESRRRQREELMYWNAMREQRRRQEQDEKAASCDEKRQNSPRHDHEQDHATPLATLEHRPAPPNARPSFDDFLTQDRSAERGTYVYNTGAQLGGEDHGLHFRRRGPAPASPVNRGISGLNASAVYANPFSDENGVDWDEKVEHEQDNMLAPDHDEVASQDADIYGASPRLPTSEVSHPISLQSVPPMPMSMPVSEAAAPAGQVLFDWQDVVNGMQTSDSPQQQPHEPVKQEESDVHVSAPTTPTLASVRSATLSVPEPPQHPLERAAATERSVDGVSNADSQHDAYASIQAWAQGSSNQSFYSPLPETPSAPMSEAEMISEGQLTPTDSMSVVDAPNAEPVVVDHNDAASAQYDVLSESDGGATPASWSEVGSVISENDGPGHQ